MPAAATYKDPGLLRFTGTIQTDAAHEKMGGYWINFPYDVPATYGVKGRVPVKAMFDGAPYTGSLVKMGDGPHCLIVVKAVRALIKKGKGDNVKVTVALDAGPRTVETPKALADALSKHGLTVMFNAMSFTCRKEYCAWISEAKKAETQARRLEKAIDMIREGKKLS